MTDENQSCPGRRESLELCPEAALCPFPQGTPARRHQNLGLAVLSTLPCPRLCSLNRRRVAGPEGGQAAQSLPTAASPAALCPGPTHCCWPPGALVFPGFSPSTSALQGARPVSIPEVVARDAGKGKGGCPQVTWLELGEPRCPQAYETSKAAPPLGPPPLSFTCSQGDSPGTHGSQVPVVMV